MDLLTLIIKWLVIFTAYGLLMLILYFLSELILTERQFKLFGRDVVWKGLTYGFDSAKKVRLYRTAALINIVFSTIIFAVAIFSSMKGYLKAFISSLLSSEIFIIILLLASAAIIFRKSIIEYKSNSTGFVGKAGLCAIVSFLIEYIGTPILIVVFYYVFFTGINCFISAGLSSLSFTLLFLLLLVVTALIIRVVIELILNRWNENKYIFLMFICCCWIPLTLGNVKLWFLPDFNLPGSIGQYYPLKKQLIIMALVSLAFIDKVPVFIWKLICLFFKQPPTDRNNMDIT